MMVASPRRSVILVVEDEAFVRMIAVDTLADHGMIVLEADCAEEALAVFGSADRIDLLFTDINMPGDLNGLDLAAIACRRQSDLKLIVTSGGQKMAAADLPDHGVFLPKPYDPGMLTRMVDASIAASH